jgi:hypothetical protein
MKQAGMRGMAEWTQQAGVRGMYTTSVLLTYLLTGTPPTAASSTHLPTQPHPLELKNTPFLPP